MSHARPRVGAQNCSCRYPRGPGLRPCRPGIQFRAPFQEIPLIAGSSRSTAHEDGSSTGSRTSEPKMARRRTADDEADEEWVGVDRSSRARRQRHWLGMILPATGGRSMPLDERHEVAVTTTAHVELLASVLQPESRLSRAAVSWMNCTRRTHRLAALFLPITACGVDRTDPASPHAGGTRRWKASPTSSFFPSTAWA